MLKKVPKQGRSERMVECILEGATRVLSTMPLAQTTTNRIAEVAGVSIGSLYQYFDCKEAIGLCLLRRHLDETVTLLRDIRVASRGRPFEERLRVPFIEVLRDHRSQPMLHLNLMALSRREVDPASGLRESRDRIVDEIAMGLAEDRPDAHEDEIRVCATLRHQGAMVLAHSAVSKPNFDRDSVVMDYFDTLNAANITLLDSSARRSRSRPSIEAGS